MDEVGYSPWGGKGLGTTEQLSTRTRVHAHAHMCTHMHTHKFFFVFLPEGILDLAINAKYNLNTENGDVHS